MSILEKIESGEMELILHYYNLLGKRIRSRGNETEIIRLASIGLEAEAKVKQCQRFNRFDCCEEYCRLYEVCKMVRKGQDE